jgi:bifunctional polynucleotide phosphatase/kinase
MEDIILATRLRGLTKDLAIFDYDGTIVKAKEGRPFPKDVDDWQYTRESVPDIIRKFNKTHQIVIVTDQTKPWKIEQIKNVMKDLHVHYTAIIGVKTQKPNISHFNKVFSRFNKTNAFYVGDAGGRKDDWSDVDKKFAENIDVKFYSPEEIFPLNEIVSQKSLESKLKEVVIMVGYPASGKSTIVKSLNNYYIVNGDLLKTSSKMVKDAEAHLDQSIVFDSTTGTKEKRAEFIKFAKKYNLPVRVFWVQTSIEESMERNKQRALEGGVKIPNVVFYVYRKQFEEPTEVEDFKLVKF